MRKNKWMLLSILLTLPLFIFFYVQAPQDAPLATLIIDKTDGEALNLPHLFYSDIALQDTTRYSLDGSSLVPDDTSYVPYTEGFISEEIYRQLMSSLSHLSPLIPTSFHDYLITDTFAVVAFSGGLESIYIIDLTTWTAYPLIYDTIHDIGHIYVSHMRVVGDELIILGGEAHRYTSLVFRVDIATRTVLSASRIPTSKEALYEEDMAIRPTGECVFVGEDHILHYNPFTDTLSRTDLPFIPSQLIPYKDTVLALHESSDTLKAYAIDNSVATYLQSPIPHYKIIDLMLDGDILYTALFDPSATRFTNYLCAYHIPSGEWLYVLGIEPLQDKALLFMA